MNLPEPRVGLVIRYAYLWREEALAGRYEGRKDLPCVILLVGQAREGGILVTVAPITHTPPAPERRADAIELPGPTQLRLGLDGERSWVLATDLNQFVWPGFDLRPIRRGTDAVAFGYLPASLVQDLRARVLAVARRGGPVLTPRSGPDA